MKLYTWGLLTLALMVGCRTPPEDEDGDGAEALVDCDDANADVFPGAEELCNGVDDDCSGDVDEDATDAAVYFADFDGDGFGSPTVSTAACAAPAGYVTDATDCDDAAGEVNPDAKDDCAQDRDLNCDGSIGYADVDGDGTPACEDCDDTDAARSPGAVEVCNGEDDDCDGDSDEDALGAAVFFEDADADGYGDPASTTEACEAPDGFVTNDSDCDDAEVETHPGADEVCDEVDQDCDGSVDEDPTDADRYYLDADGDGQGGAVTTEACAQPSGFVANDDDCDDLNAKAYVGAAESCDGVDNDCNGAVPTNELDGDADGFFACEGDCNDAAANVSPAAPEICDGVDNDCDNSVDDGAIGQVSWFADTDGDGFGAGSAVTGCTLPSSGVSFIAGDCNDTKSNVNPNATEVCDSLDNDCDGSVDESAIGKYTWYTDADADGYGVTSSATSGCTLPTSGVAVVAGDCDDAKGAVHPNAREYCDALDRDCDGDPDNDALDGKLWYTDADDDGFGDPNNTQWACSQPSNAVTDASDCADDEIYAFPGSSATEIPFDGVDMDCDGNDYCTDLNCDGMPDLVLPSHHDGDYAVTSKNALSSGAGLRLAGPALTQYGTLGVNVADLDKDGYQDLIYSSYSDSGAGVYQVNSQVFWGSATGHSDSDKTSLPTEGAHRNCVADLNGDGWKDIVFAGYRNNAGYNANSYVYWSASGVFSASNRTALPTVGAVQCAVEDLNADGRPDIVFAQYHDGDYSVNSYVYYNTASGFNTTNRTDLPTVGAYDITVADLNEDGRKDIVYWSHYSGSSHQTDYNYVYWGSSTGFSIGNRLAFSSYGAFKGAVEDLNGDGHLDIVAAGYYNGAWTNDVPQYILWGDGTTNYSTARRTTLTSKGILEVVVDDIDEDGFKDLLMASHHDGDSYTASMIFWGAAGGAYTNGSRTDLYGYQTEYGAAVADLDDDGDKDIILPGYHNNGWANMAWTRIYWNSPSGRPTGAAYTELESRGAWDIAVVGD